MSKKTIYIIISVILVIVLILLFGYYILVNNPNGTNPSAPNVFKNFFPFGGENTNNNIAPNTDDPVDVPVSAPTNDFVKKLRKISAEPVAGAGILDVKAGSVLRYIEKATGHIYEVELFSPRAGRISNTTIPMVYDAIWGNKNNSIMARYLKEDNFTVDTLSLTVKDTSTTTENTISGISFPSKITDVSVFGNSVFYLTQEAIGSRGYISGFNGGNKKIVWDSALGELTSQYVNARTITLTTKPHEGSEGFLLFVDPTTGTSIKILGNLYGLTTNTNPEGTDVLYSKIANGLEMGIFNIKNKTTTLLSPSSFPEKCVWSKKDRNVIYCFVSKQSVQDYSLTEWYKGLVQFEDDIWKYDIQNQSANIILDINIESGESVDGIKPMLSDNDQYLIFINKKDNSLWSLDLTK